MGDDGVYARKGSARLRKISAKVVEVMVDDATRKRAAAARLESLENDYVAVEPADDDDEYRIPLDGDDNIGIVKHKKGYQAVRKRQTRQSLASSAARASKKVAPKPFADLLAEARLDALPPGQPSYLTAAMGPPQAHAPRRFCSVCGAAGRYCCPLCGARFCCAGCQAVHRETRCLKFVA